MAFDLPIPQFYNGRNVFITGGSGFMGMVLIERLLSTCPDIGRIYLLMRPKKEKNPEERLNHLKQCQVFNILREKCPWQLDKLRFIPGDVTQVNLGLSQESVELLKEVSIIFHSAATIKFNEVLQTAVSYNVRPVIDLMSICDDLPYLEAFVYVSTAYSNCEISNIEEKVYPPPVPLQGLLNFVENSPDSRKLDETLKYIQPKPNSYTFTKAMAESIVEQHAITSKYSIAIFRPTIVTSSLKKPFPGWIANFHGVPGVITGTGKGLLHVLNASAKSRIDQLPVDVAIDSLIAVAWETAIDKPNKVRVYNCSSIENPQTYEEFIYGILRIVRTYPVDIPFWYPFIVGSRYRFLFKIMEMCLQTLPLSLAAYLLRLFALKSSNNLLMARDKLSSMSEVMSYIITREYNFEINNMKQLRSRLTKIDAGEIFNLDPRSIVWNEYYINVVCGIRQFLIKRSDDHLEFDRRRLRVTKVLHFSTIMAIVWLLIKIMKKMIRLAELKSATKYKHIVLKSFG